MSRSTPVFISLIQITSFDFLVNYESTFIPSNFLNEIDEHFNLDDTNVDFHWWFNLVDTDDVANLIEFVTEKQVYESHTCNDRLQRYICSQ